MKNIAITTGGTGGHIYPALALLEELRKKGYNVIFIGTEHRMEKDLVPSKNYKFYGLDILPLNKVKNIFKMLKAVYKSRKILKENNIDTVIGFGNYISIPTVLAARLLKLNIYIQEQNILMGSANKFLKRFAKKVFLAFDESLKYIKDKNKDKYIVTGNPLREEFYNISKEKAREKLGIDVNKKVVLVVGGSLGAKNINDAMIYLSEEIDKKNDVLIYWATGKKLYTDVLTRVRYQDNLVLKDYFDNVYEIMAAADILVSRAGASTISEIIELRKPSILIPYDFVGQSENALMLEYINASKVYTNEKAKNAINEAINLTYKESVLKFMIENLDKIYTGNAVLNIIKEMKEEENEK
ncbi:undecaprenyldiphospho-muramoylpentapeptide beta-N-acetylglucosaminyltransferase [Oceanivirga miroungae]|uniref:UDP-N-acetylglucosamine--N-acetylmuramyl-(pentapeptide) pyrophosphoryl-undecaprenol N-acetylglucosamine transferase n=1 Tax=Oceanivirga miroungae TaxID=1130046 RepID=A0A6I8M8V9_9FUSO|nr:undecaprenyldiphospho-muramoylpentapeptide beta-N-acetylglucosaminyltransferase [Oceanivirga miroungae]VWL85937.1 undecaprenyldiphospho-muramoylpentapeptide beta-N -acetylglucosaminyltransferase [Oceanivirga miroungae]